RSRLARSSVAGLALAVGQGRQLREAIAEAVGDPTLELAYCVDDGDRFVDREGRRFDLPADGSGRAATMVELEGRRIGALVHDDTGKVIRIVAGGLDITERKRQEEELRASRTRLVAAGDDARRRLERNLHDGAQQRLVSLSVALRLAQSKLASDPVAAG